jgi:hypothetical protein
MSVHRQEFLYSNKTQDQYLYKAPVQRSMYIPPTELSRIGQRNRNVPRSPNASNPMMFDDALYAP